MTYIYIILIITAFDFRLMKSYALSLLTDFLYISINLQLWTYNHTVIILFILNQVSHLYKLKLRRHLKLSPGVAPFTC